MMTPNKYQQEVFNFIQNGKGHAVVEAVAGSGKTTTIVQALKLIPKTQSVIFLAFNKHIATELAQKVPSNTMATTFHSLGLRTMTQSLGGRINVNNNKVYQLYFGTMENEFPQLTNDEIKSAFSPIKQLLGLLKGNLHPVTPECVDFLIDRYTINLDCPTPLLTSILTKLLELDLANLKDIDFDDMIYIPVKLHFQFQKFDWVFVDECLPGKTRILLSDGTEKNIYEIVKNQLPVEVVTYNTSTGKQEMKKVVGWSEKPTNDKKMIKITHAEKHKIVGRGNGYHVQHTLFCTDNHLIFTWERGFIYSNELKVGEHVQFESAHGNRKLKNVGGDICATLHSGNVDCEVCGKTCKSLPALGSHMRIHNPDYPGNNMSKEGHEVLSNHYKHIMDNPESRKKMAETKSRKMKNGEIPVKYGGHIGNGTPTKQQLKLYYELIKHDSRWELEWPVSTGDSYMGDNKYPSNYKIDLAFFEHKLGIEVNGNAHLGKKQRILDKKKKDLLESKGWLIHEIWNDEIDKNVDDCVNKILASLVGRSPHWSEILSMEEVEYTNDHVYDIEVEDNHNFYAEGTLVHNCQDLNPAQIEIVKRCLKPNGRVIAVGDRFQSIYGFRGADSDAIPNVIESLNATVLPLSITYRCPTSHVAHAKEYVPEIEAAPNAPTGTLADINIETMLDQIIPTDMVLCRYNAPLVRPAFALLQQGIKVNIKGRDIGTGLLTLIKKLRPKNLDDLVNKLAVWETTEKTKAEKKKRNTESIEDKYDVLMAFVDNVESIPKLKSYIKDIFSDNRSEITFSSIHKAKGLEADNIYVLQPELMPSKYATKDWEISQERNCMYVAYTRAKKALYMVH